MHFARRALGVLAFILVAALPVLADPPSELDYQGKVLINDLPFTGPGYFKYAVSSEDGLTNFWSNSGTAVGEPTGFVTNTCINGVFSCILGGAPTVNINPDIFSRGTALVLRVWFSSDKVSFSEMLPAQDLLSSAYAINADQVDGYDAAEIIAAATNGVTLSGDIAGTPGGGTTVNSLQGDAVNVGTPAAGNVLTWNGTAWSNAPASGGGMDPAIASNSFVEIAGDTMTGALTINSPRGLVVGSASNEVEIGRNASGADNGTAVGYSTLATNYGTAVGWDAAGDGGGVGVGVQSLGSGYGVAVGEQAIGVAVGAAVGSRANGSISGAAVASRANGSVHGAAVGYFANGHNYGVAVGDMAGGTNSGVAVGRDANGHNEGVAVGRFAQGADGSVAVGYAANGQNNGSAVGQQANGVNAGVSVGNFSDGNTDGAAAGYNAKAFTQGAAMGRDANGAERGAAVGYQTTAPYDGIAVGYTAFGEYRGIGIGYAADGANTNIAIGAGANSRSGNNSIAIGQNVQNSDAESARIRGTLYLDGATGIYYRTGFGSGGWVDYAATFLTSDTNYVKKTGDTMTGTLTINAADGLRIDSASNEVVIGKNAVASNGSVAVGNGAVGENQAVGVGGFANGGDNGGVAVGYGAIGWDRGAAVGYSANARVYGAVLGHSAQAPTYGVAVGWSARGNNDGTAVGYMAVGTNRGAAVGLSAVAGNYGAALGRSANGQQYGTAIGAGATAVNTNIAVGVAADAQAGSERIAIGHDVTNTVDDSARIRGTLYMDGGTALVARSTFGTGAWRTLIPLPLLENAVWVATNGTPAGPGTIDRPYDTPQNGYNNAAVRYPSEPSVVVICAGRYPGLLNMTAKSVHVFGLDRPQLGALTVNNTPAGFIAGKIRVENIVFTDTATVSADMGGVKFNNCRFQNGLYIYGGKTEVMNCFMYSGDAQALIVGNGTAVADIAIYNSAVENDSGTYPAADVAVLVSNFEMKGNQVVNIGGGPALRDQETPGPINPLHLYTHNYFKGPGAAVGPGGVGAVVNPPNTTNTIAFHQNTVWGHAGVVSSDQVHANNSLYGIVRWGQGGMGAGLDAYGNAQFNLTFQALPDSWDD